MGTRGPAPKPTAILKLHNSWHAKKREAEGEIKPATGRPKAPAFLHKNDEDAWKLLIGQLEKIPGLLTVIDGPQLERYARYLVRWKLIESELEAFRTTTKPSLLNKETRQVLRLLWSESRALDLHLKQIEEKFGLTPSARTRIRLWHNVSDEAAANAKNTDGKPKSRFFGKQA